MGAGSVFEEASVASQRKHVSTGASSFERWDNCPGSGFLIAKMGRREEDEPDYTKEGTTWHTLVAKCLEQEREPWEFLGEPLDYPDFLVDDEMVDAAEVALETCRPLMTPATLIHIEEPLTAPRIGPQYHCTPDFASITTSLLNLVEWKYGRGVYVPVEENSQLLYQAYGFILRNPSIRRVVLRVVQPRFATNDGPVRRWETTAQEVCEWATAELLPAFKRAETDRSLEVGEWCRFCPARLICPMQTALLEAAANFDPQAYAGLSDAQLGQNYRLAQAAKRGIRAIEQEVERRWMLGQEVPCSKLVTKRARERVWRDGAEAVAAAQFGDDAYTRQLKKPNQLEKVDKAAKALVKEWAYLPDVGVKVVPEDAPGAPIKIARGSEVFKLLATEEDE